MVHPSLYLSKVGLMRSVTGSARLFFSAARRWVGEKVGKSS
jgi:hypothetical protein